jgi:hypothetical protein
MSKEDAESVREVRAFLVPELMRSRIVTTNQITALLANVFQEADHLKMLEGYGNGSHFRSFFGDQCRYHGEVTS